MAANPANFDTFRLTGHPAREAGMDNLRPALFAAYRDLSTLRYDFPLVLVDGGGDEWLSSLSGLIDHVLRGIAPAGTDGERLRKHVLRLETEIRRLVLDGAGGRLSEVRTRAEENLLAEVEGDEHDLLADSFARARDAIPTDGELVDCGAETPVECVTHAWAFVQAEKGRRFRARIGSLVIELNNVLRADFMKSDAARDPDALRRSFGTSFENAFDFNAMSGLIKKTDARDALPENRRRRIDAALSVLEGQRFFPLSGADEAYPFVFDSCADAVGAYRDRLPELVEVFKAILIAGLEIENGYREDRHDPLFDNLDAAALSAEDMDIFPNYLVCLHDDALDDAETASVIDTLSSGLPVKIMVRIDDILPPADEAGRRLWPGTAVSSLARMAPGLGEAFVLQASAAQLHRLRDELRAGLSSGFPALISLFSGAVPGAGETRDAPGPPPYLMAAAATESRAFPSFVHDPGAGDDLASRFSIDSNPQPESDWPRHEFVYEDAALRRVVESLAFSLIDFVAADHRHAHRFATVTEDDRPERMIPVVEALESGDDGIDDPAPYVLMIDGKNTLHRVVVERGLIEAARRCRNAWRTLREMGGIHNSHAERLLERERWAWETEKAEALEALRKEIGDAAQTASRGSGEDVPGPSASQASGGDAPGPSPASPPEAPRTEPPEAPPSDEPYVETARCTTCDECTNLNNRMFAYDENKQAYIADPDAGTFRDLVMAAESCQVAIIHPGKPRNPDEPDLEDLIRRAEAFN